jgi:Fungal specific transcription factor domain
MAVSIQKTSYQPFQCLICQSRFTRHENLKRHAAVHSHLDHEAALSCDLCQVTFSRPDLRLRHMKRKHPEEHHETPPARRFRNKTPPEPLIENPQSLTPQQSGDEEKLEMDGGTWYPELPSIERQLDRDQQLESVNPETTTAATPPSLEKPKDHIDEASITKKQSANESTYIAHAAQHAFNLEQSLIPGASILEPLYHLNTSIYSATSSQSTLSDATMASNNLNRASLPDSLLSNNLPPPLQQGWFPSSSQIARGVRLYFAHVSHFVPFLHEPTFDAARAPRHLILSMLSLAYQHGEDPDCGEEEGSGVTLSTRCFHRARIPLTSNQEKSVDLARNTIMVQVYLLLQICAMLYLCGENSSFGLQLHSKMIILARSGGLMQPLPMESAETEDLDSLWREFIKAESHKRTLFAVHQIDALWYQFLSIPRSLSHLEIKHDLPCPEDRWLASSSAQWAHRQLLGQQPGSSVQYTDAIRRFLSPSPDFNSLPVFDPYGAINIAQFLISSAREITGWSTMTGRLSMDRFEAIRTSLVALNPFIVPRVEVVKSSHKTLCEATWEMAMIELQIWSSSHTGGIVEGSLDGVLKMATYLAPSSELLLEFNSIQPHVDWFLLYLETTLTPDSEPPWVTLYAYKAFLIVWQLINGGISGGMQVVGIDDGDVKETMAWARKVFGRRQRWQLGKLIMKCLDLLEK